MSMIRYIVQPEKQGEWSRPLRKRWAVRKCRRQLKQRGEIFQIKRKGTEDWSRGRDLKGTMVRLRDLLQHAAIGDQFAMRGVLTEGPVNIRKIAVWPEPADTKGIPAVDQFVAILNERWPNWRNGGIAVCKQTVPGSWSDHAYAAALDVFDTRENMEEIRDFARRHHEELGIKYVILYDRIWTRTAGTKSYGGNYHWHVHISFDHGPERLACA